MFQLPDVVRVSVAVEHFEHASDSLQLESDLFEGCGVHRIGGCPKVIEGTAESQSPGHKRGRVK